MEERAGERRFDSKDAPLLGPLPTRASQGEEEEMNFMTKIVKKILIVSAAIAHALAIPSAQKAISAPKDEELFGDPVIVKSKDFQIKRSQLENAFIGFKSNAA